MFPTFIGILDIQSWWEVPSIAHFCSLFRDAFNLLDFDIEDLEEALLTDSGTEGQNLLQELIVRLLGGCLPDDTRNDISTFNYQMFLRRLFRKKCQEYKCENPFNTDVDFELLPLRQKVEILRDLCDFRLDAVDVEEALSNLDSDSLRVEPLGHDRKNSAYWYFYGTRLYREDYIDISNTVSSKQKNKPKDKRRKRCWSRLAKEEKEEEEKEEDSLVSDIEDSERESIWQVVCFTLQDWSRLVEKFKNSEHITERQLYKTLSQDFMPEIPKLFDLKEKQQRRKILQRSVRTVQSHESDDIDDQPIMVKSKIKTKTNKTSKKNTSQTSKNVKTEEDIVPPPVQKKGRQTNNSLASAVGQILIDTRDEVTDVESKKGSGKHGGSVASAYGYGFNIGIEEEEQQVGMHKVLNILKDHEDAWPFTDPVDEQYAPRYYSVVRRPMDLSKMEEKLEEGSYKTIGQFKRDFRLIIDNCKQYNGSDNEYTEMAMNLKDVFDRAVDRYLESEQSSDDSLSCGSGAGVNSPSYKNKNSSPSSIRHSQRHKHSRKLHKKTKLGNKISKKKTRQRAYDDSVKEENEPDSKVVKVKDKKNKKKTKKCKSNVKQEIDEEQENEGAISDANVIKSKKKRSGDCDRTVSKNNKNASVKDDIDEELVRANKKVKNEKEIRQEKELHTSKELKENRKRKDDFEEDYDLTSIPKSKSRKIEKKESKELDVLIDRVRKSKIKKEESRDRSIEEDEKLLSPTIKGKKNRKVNKEKSESPVKHNDKEKEKKSKKKKTEQLKNGELKKETEVKNVERSTNANKGSAKKIESSVKNDTESLDSLKDRISERRREEKIKLEQEKKKKLCQKNDSLLGTKKVPSNGSTYHHDIDKTGNKKVKSKKTNKDEKICESKSKNQEESEPKKIKTCYSKYTKVSGKKDSAIQALNQATEQTLNDINKWLDDAPRLSEFSSGSDSPVFHASTSDSSRSAQNKQQQVSSASSAATTTLVSASVTGEALSRKRPSSIKLIGPQAPPPRPKKVQRTIDRLQPGKSKGNLLSKKLPSNESAPTNDTTVSSSLADNEQVNKDIEDGPKLSLGTVLKNVDSIQLICKSLVSSPNPNLSNDEDEEMVSKPATPQGNFTEEQTPTVKKSVINTFTAKDEKSDKKVDNEEAQKPKSATPNLSAWFKAFGAPKSKKKDDDEEIMGNTIAKKDEQVPESSGIGIGGRQRRMSTGGSSVSESVSSFSQESPPSGTGRSPHQSQHQALTSVMPSPAAIEPQIRGAGFYQDALSTGSSPYNSPYYTTPPRYSAQLPPTPSPQNHPLSPAYPSSAAFDQATSAQSSQPTTAQSSQPTPPSLYSQISPQTSHQSFQKPSPPSQSPTTFSQQSPQSEPQPYPSSTLASSQSPVYPQQSPQPLQSSPYPQSSPQPANYSQSSPQTQPPTPSYSQSSPQTPASSYSQPSPSQAATLNFSQPSPQQQHSPYSQSSPQPPPSYSQPSPQSQQHSPYSQPSPQQPNYSQVSPKPPSSTYSQPSPQPPGYTAQTPSPYSQPDLVIAQPSPQPRGYSQTSPQQPAPSYSQPSPQTPSPYSAQPSPQQQSASYSQPSPQTPPSYSQPSPQQPRGYSLPSPQQSTQQQQTVNSVQQQPITSYSQPSPQNQTQQRQQIQTNFAKSADDYTQNLSTLPFSQQVKSAYLQSSAASTPIVKPSATKEKQVQQQQPTTEQHLTALNQQVYQSAASTQYPPTYPGSVFPSADRMNSQLSTETSIRSTTSRLTNHEGQQQLTQQRQVTNRLQAQQSQEQQSPLLSFQQNLSSHETLYSSSFQTTPYPMPNAACRPVYPGYFDTSAKSATGPPSSGSSLAPVKKRMYNEPSTAADAATQRAPGQDQFGFDSLMALAHSQSDVSVPNQFDSSFASSLADSVGSNSPYARLQLGLVARSAKETQQLLSIPRPSSKGDPLTAYGRSSAPGQSELDLNLLQSLQNAAAKNSGMLSMSRRVTDQSATVQPASVSKAKRSKKSKAQQQHQQQQQQQQQQQPQQQQQQLNVAIDQQTGIPGFPQYGPVGTDPIGLKQSAVGGSAFNFATSAGTANSSPFYDKEATASAAAAAYAFLDDFRNPNLPNYYNMLRQQQQAAQVQQHQAQQQAAQQQQVTPVSDAAQQVCNKLTSQTAARNYSSHPFLHSAQRPTPYATPVPPYVTPHGANLGVDPAAYQQYLHSLYALQPPPQHRPTWL